MKNLDGNRFRLIQIYYHDFVLVTLFMIPTFTVMSY